MSFVAVLQISLSDKFEKLIDRDKETGGFNRGEMGVYHVQWRAIQPN